MSDREYNLQDAETYCVTLKSTSGNWRDKSFTFQCITQEFTRKILVDLIREFLRQDESLEYIEIRDDGLFDFLVSLSREDLNSTLGTCNLVHEEGIVEVYQINFRPIRLYTV